MKTGFKIVGVLVLVLVASSFLSVSAIKKGYLINEVVEDFTLKNVTERMVSLSDYKESKGVIVVFTCNTCPYAIAYEDRFIALNKKYAPKGYPVIAINPNNPEVRPGDSFKAMQTQARKKAYSFPYLFDEGQTVYPKFGATKTPHVFVLENTKKGSVVRYIGALDDNHEEPEKVKKRYVENAVDALLEGKKVKKAETKAIGCSIKV